jgi:hypothetical protein
VQVHVQVQAEEKTGTRDTQQPSKKQEARPASHGEPRRTQLALKASSKQQAASKKHALRTAESGAPGSGKLACLWQSQTAQANCVGFFVGRFNG